MPNLFLLNSFLAYYCPNHGQGSHDFNYCYYNPDGKNFKKDKYDQWVKDGKPSLIPKGN